MFNSIAPARNPDHGKLEEQDAVQIPKKPDHGKLEEQDALKIPKKPDHRKLEEDGDENVDADYVMKYPAQWLLKQDFLSLNSRSVVHKMKDDELELPRLRKWASYAYYDGEKKKEVDPPNPNPFYFSPEDLAEMYPCGLPNGGKCRICLKEAHINCSGCPYLNSCPIGAQVGHGYYIACKHCGHPLDGKPLDKTSYCCILQEAHASAKKCFKCWVHGDHTGEDCLKETKDVFNPWI